MHFMYGWYSVSSVETSGLHHYIQCMTTETTMTKILLAVENYLAYSTIYQTLIPPLFALKLQMRMHRMFPKTFAQRIANMCP